MGQNGVGADLGADEQVETGLRPLGISPAGWVVVLLVLGLLGLVGIGLVRAQNGPVGVGSEAPDFTLTTFDGREISLSSLEGQVVLINFWASWCKPCEQEAEELERAYRMYRGGGVVFLGVNYVDTEGEALAYLERFAISYPNGPDLGTRISQSFRIRGVPESYVIGPDGRIVSVKIGPYESLEEITTALDEALPQ